jgi:hypothetical protein
MRLLMVVSFLAVLAASLWLTYVVVKLILNRLREPVFPLPPGVKASCSFQACQNLATTGLRDVVEELNTSGEYRYLSEDKPGVYCDKHRPSFGYCHPYIQIFIAVTVWVCLIWALVKA